MVCCRDRPWLQPPPPGSGANAFVCSLEVEKFDATAKTNPADWRNRRTPQVRGAEDMLARVLRGLRREYLRYFRSRSRMPVGFEIVSRQVRRQAVRINESSPIVSGCSPCTDSASDILAAMPSSKSNSRLRSFLLQTIASAKPSSTSTDPCWWWRALAPARLQS